MHKGDSFAVLNLVNGTRHRRQNRPPGDVNKGFFKLGSILEGSQMSDKFKGFHLTMECLAWFPYKITLDYNHQITKFSRTKNVFTSSLIIPSSSTLITLQVAIDHLSIAGQWLQQSCAAFTTPQTKGCN